MNDRTSRDTFSDRWNLLMASEVAPRADRRWGEGEHELLEEWRSSLRGLIRAAENLAMALRNLAGAFERGARAIFDFLSQYSWFRHVEVQETHLRSRDARVRPLRAEPGRTLRPVVVDQRPRIRSYYGRHA